MADIEICGTEPDRLDDLRESGVDHGGNPVEPFVDESGGWPLRCCLSDSRAGDSLAIVAWSPFTRPGAYAEVGPIVIHADGCSGWNGAGVPAQFAGRDQLLRPYDHDQRILYDRIAIVRGIGIERALGVLLADDDVDFVLVRNVLSGCWSFTARRA